jgi:uncharacterized protein YjdB
MRRRYPAWLSVPSVVFGLLPVVACGVDTEGNTFTGITDTPSNGCTGCQDVVAVRVNPAQSTIAVGETIQLTGEAVNSSGAILVGRTIAWLTSDVDIAKIASDGIVTGLAAGSVTISGATGGVTGTATVTVNPATGP